MSQAQPPEKGRPGPDELAGVYFYFEGPETVKKNPPPGTTPASSGNRKPPTQEELSGVNMLFEGNEHVYLPGKPQPPKPEQP